MSEMFSIIAKNKSLRWIGFFPLAAACLTLIPIILGYMHLLWFKFMDPFLLVGSLFGSEGFFMHYVVPLYCNIAGGTFYVGVGAYVAPSHKKVVSITLLVILIMVYGFLLIYNLNREHYFQCLITLSAISGGFYACLEENKKGDV